MVGLLAVYAYIAGMVAFTWLIRRRDDNQKEG
jgi:hypothetical protein